MSKPKVSLIISNFNGMQLNLIKDCIKSLIKPHYQNWELIVIDNASTDNSVDYLKRRLRRYKNCFIVQNQLNIYSQGLNLGAQNASGKYLAYFNNDAAITKNYLNNLVEEFEKDKKLAIAQGKLLSYRNHKKIDSAGETMDIYGNPLTIGFGENDRGQYDGIEDILSASGSACMIKKSILNKIGGYDPTFGIGYEDMDLALRARRLGFKIKRFPKAVIYHKRAATDLADFIRVRVKWHFNKNRIVTMLKNYPILLLIRTLPLCILLYLGIAFYEWIIRKNWRIGWVRISSLSWCILNIPKILSIRNATYKIGLREMDYKVMKLFSFRPVTESISSFINMK